MIGWLTSSTAPPNPFPALADAVSGTASFVVETLWTWGTAHGFGDIHPTAILGLWLLFGAVFLVASHAWSGTVVLAGWSAATVWVVVEQSRNPVPAALTAAAIATLWLLWRAIISGLAKLH